ncbi:MAG: NADPH-dependent 7-cyano-7-deazaguanine reductase QueF [Gammaproteobacteria bacterium]|nr:NADPH-dependent 7-cyano-7-deazaguanine reductase QueF [Gammaproteobacteria bacterium]
MSDIDKDFSLDTLALGKVTKYMTTYTPDLLQAVPRSMNRNELEITGNLPFFGEDIWQGYELSWLNNKGKPIVALLKCYVPCSSPNLIESKSFKLYLNSFNQSRFQSQIEVQETLEHDLSQAAGCPLRVELFTPDNLRAFEISALPGACIDELDIEVVAYDLDPLLLKLESDSQINESNKYKEVSEVLHSHLLKSNCLITNQPDWASVVISYTGSKICRESLLRYLISFRMHNEFHEQCVERVFTDLMKHCGCKELSVQAFYTRRGGLDINPFRSTDPTLSPPDLRVNRQ